MSQNVKQLNLKLYENATMWKNVEYFKSPPCIIIGNPQLILHTLTCTDHGPTQFFSIIIQICSTWIGSFTFSCWFSPILSMLIMHGSITYKIFSLHDCHFHNLAHVQYLVYVRQRVSKNDQARTCMHVHVHV